MKKHTFYQYALLVSALGFFLSGYFRDKEIHNFLAIILYGIWVATTCLIEYMKQFEYDK